MKPLSGGFDLVHKTSEGIKNTAGYLDKERVDRRIRHPRCFYGEGDIVSFLNSRFAFMRRMTHWCLSS